jgi:hypothetical protein
MWHFEGNFLVFIGYPNLANKNIGCTVNFEFQIDINFLACGCPMWYLSHVVLGTCYARNYWLFI